MVELAQIKGTPNVKKRVHQNLQFTIMSQKTRYCHEKQWNNNGSSS